MTCTSTLRARWAGPLFAAAVLFCLALQAPAVRAAGWPGVFDPYEAVTLHLEMDSNDWNRIRFDQPSQDESWVPEVAQAWMRGADETPILVAVRRKGESDLPLPSADDPRKVSLKIDINEYVAGQKWHDLKKLSLENGSTAPLREGFAWVVHRQAEPLYGYAAALSGWVRLFINGEEVGLYTSTEQRDETFLRNHDLYSPTCTWLYKVDGTTELEVGVSNSPAYANLQFAPFNSGPGGGGKPPSGGGTAPDFDVHLPQWINMRGMLSLAACNAFTENSDSLFTHDGKNTFCVDFYPPHPRTRRYYPWDLDTGIKQGTASIYGSTQYQTMILDHPWFGRVYEHILRELLDGPLSVASLTNALSRMETGLSAAALSDPYVYPDGAAAEFEALRAWVATRNASIRSQFRHPFVPRPAFNHPGGEVAPGFALTIGAPTGTVYYTVDGTDPRAPGGSPSASAAPYTAPLTVEAHLHVIARTLVGTNWCGLPAEAAFSLATHGSALRVTEIMYNPVDLDPSDSRDNDAYEFIEFRNTGGTTLDLSTFICDGITFTFSNGFTVASGAYVVLVRDPAAFAERYPGVVHHGVYLGKLDNGGEKIRVRRPDGTTVLSVEYDDDPPWVISPDGLGYSLVNTDTDASPDIAAGWRASAARFGSPGADDPEPTHPTGVVFNEILSHTDPPLEDAIELFNPTAVAADLSGWYLSDAARDANGDLDPVRLKKYRIPDGTVVPPGGFAVFYENAFNGASALSPFALGEFGERVYLSAADASGTLVGHLIALEFPALENGVSFGRIPTSTGPQYAPLAARTFGADDPANLAEFRTGHGATNAPPRTGPVVINEIMYNPPTHLTEFVEMHNITASAVDLSGWTLNGAGGFVFPSGTLLPASGFALVVDTNRLSVEAFRVDRNVPEACLVFGGSFALDNNGERLTLARPNTSALDPPFPVDSVRYNDKTPWPTEADGGGPSLERYVSAAYGGEPLNWRTARTGGSPGRTNLFDLGLAVTSGSRWRYRAVSASLGTAWRETDYADTLWPDGHAPLGYGEPGLATTIPYGPDPTHKYPTTYFRKLFTLPEDPASLNRLTLEVAYDDGFVAYLNGVEVARGAMPAGPAAYETLAGDHESGPFETLDLTWAIAHLRKGANLLSVELHQADPASQDLVWDARLTYETPGMRTAAAPTATPGGTRFIDPLAVTLACSTPGAEIRYTLDGTEPGPASPLYSDPLTLVVSTRLNARAFALDYSASPPISHLYEKIDWDADADGLPDDWELTHFGSISTATGTDDADSDGASNHDEYVCGTDPGDPASVLRHIIRPADGVPVVRYATVATDPASLAYRGLGRYYTLMAVERLAGSAVTWADVAGESNVPGDGTVRSVAVPSDQASGFYKLRVWLGSP
jgi:hypothetical protein